MVPAHLSLERISTGHSVFERDQVLTHDQLNSLADFADDQTRLTRVRLLGVGIVCGLRARLVAGNRVRLSRGVGVTSDGDLVHVEEEVEYDRFVEYDDSFPAYPPLMDGSAEPPVRRRAHQLVAVGEENDRAEPLGSMTAADHGFTLAGATAVLLMESYLQDDDLCSGTDCDNLGQEAVHTLKLILVANATGALLREDVKTPADAFAGVPPLHADRPAFGTATDLHARYRTACQNTLGRLKAAIDLLDTKCPALCQEVLGGPASAMKGKLDGYFTTHAPSAAPAHVSIQYFHAFLTDVVEAYNDLVEAFFDDRTVCAPAFGAFPKHLVLGELGAAEPSVRTRFYPSPLTSRTADGQSRAAFLLKRLDALVGAFAIPPKPATPVILVTPSAGPDRPLEERAIPFYYSPAGGAASPVRRYWSQRHARRGTEKRIYGYHAVAAGAEGPALDPLAAHVGSFTHFRVEGHLGHPVADVLTRLNDLIRDRNLPFAVRAVLLGTDVAHLRTTPPLRRAELYHLHQILRRELRRRVQEAKAYAAHLGGEVATAIAGNVVKNVTEEGAAQPVGQIASTYRDAVQTSADQTLNQLRQAYSEYPAGGDWQARLATLLQQASLFKRGISPVTQLVFDTPFDVLIGSTHSEWLPYLDQLIAHQELAERKRFLYAVWAARHPQMEHLGGVPRGGTLVLVYDPAGNVVADFALPYVPHEAEAESIDPPLTDPPARPAQTLQQGVKIVAARKDAVEEEVNRWELERFKPKWTLEIHDHMERYIKPEIDRRFQDERGHMEFYHGSLKDILQGLIVQPEVRAPVGPKGPTTVSDHMYTEARTQIEEMRTLQELLRDRDTPETQKAIYHSRLQSTQQAFAARVETAARHLALGETDLRTGSVGRKALTTLVEGTQMLAGTDYGQQAAGAMLQIAQGAENATYRNIVETNLQAGKR